MSLLRVSHELSLSLSFNLKLPYSAVTVLPYGSTEKTIQLQQVQYNYKDNNYSYKRQYKETIES